MLFVIKEKNTPFVIVAKKNPFNVEKCRQNLAESGDLVTLSRMYSSSFKEIKNLNTSKFWDSKFSKHEDLSRQDGMTKERIKIVSSFIPDSAKKVLDIGAGAGFIEELIFKRENIEIYANDISSNAIRNLEQRFKGNFTVKSIYKMNYSGNFFDAILSLEVLEHIPPHKIMSVLSNIRKILKKKGILILSIPTNEGLEYMKNNPNGHVRCYTIPLIKAELEMMGFEIFKVRTLMAFKNYYFIKKVLTKILINRWKPNVIVIKAKKI